MAEDAGGDEHDDAPAADDDEPRGRSDSRSPVRRRRSQS